MILGGSFFTILITMNKNELKKLQNEQLSIMKEVVDICNKHDLNYFMAYGSLLGTIRHQGTIPWDYDIDLFMIRDDYLNFTRFMKDLPKNLIIKKMYTNDDVKVSLVRLYKKETRVYHKNHDDDSRIDGIHIDIFILDYAKNYSKILKKIILSICKYLSLCQLDKFERKWLYDRFQNNKIKKCIVASSRLISSLYNSDKIQKMLYSLLVSENPTSKYLCILDLRVQAYWNKNWFGKGIQKVYENFKVNVPECYDLILKNMYGNYLELPPEKDRFTSNMKDIIIEFNSKNTL